MYQISKSLSLHTKFWAMSNININPATSRLFLHYLNTIMMEVSIVKKPAHLFAEQTKELLSI